MNFFVRQEEARKQTRKLVFLFILAMLGVIAAVDVVALVGFGFMSNNQITGGSSPWPAIAVISGLTFLVIVAGSAFRLISLGQGGGYVARQMGGERVTPDTADPVLRRYYHVVEEMALASGLPVPQVYVIENEKGINAFAAGHEPADAAVAVTRGCLDQLTRAELQGVIGHEFSHILNGDMRLNIRLIGWLAGITLLATIGRKMLYFGRYSSGSRRSDNGGAVIAIALTAMLVGWVGLFFGRWIKAAISRQREFLADASSVQFTRHPESLAGALKKIGGFQEGSSFKQHDAEDVTHMLFAQGLMSPAKMFATHPPLEDRIKAIDPSFNSREYTKNISNQHQNSIPNELGVMGMVGSVNDESLRQAEILRTGVANKLDGAMDTPDKTRALVFSLVLNKTQLLRQKQLDIIELKFDQDLKNLTLAQSQTTRELDFKQRHAALDQLVPILNTQAPEDREKLLETLDELIRADGQITVAEFSLYHMLKVYHKDSLTNARNKPRYGFGSRREEIAMLLTILSRAGHADDHERRKAFDKAIKTAGWDMQPLSMPGSWTHTLEEVLDKLDYLTFKDKELLLKSLIAVVSYDGEIKADEYDLLRAICASLHIPLALGS
ncbi:MAG: M48 family metallopeptidase [bacterium]